MNEKNYRNDLCPSDWIELSSRLKSGEIGAICGFPGIGKTYLTNIDRRFVDGFFSRGYYNNGDFGSCNPAFLEDYRAFVRETRQAGRIVIGATNETMRKILVEEGVNYALITLAAGHGEEERICGVYDARNDERQWREYNKQIAAEKIQRLSEETVPDVCMKLTIPIGFTLSEALRLAGYLEPLGSVVFSEITPKDRKFQNGLVRVFQSSQYLKIAPSVGFSGRLANGYSNLKWGFNKNSEEERKFGWNIVIISTGLALDGSGRYSNQSVFWGFRDGSGKVMVGDFLNVDRWELEDCNLDNRQDVGYFLNRLAMANGFNCIW